MAEQNQSPEPVEDEMSDMVRIPDKEARRMLHELARVDIRADGKEAAWIIRQEYARRFSQPNPLITIADAQAAATAIQE